MNRLKEFTEQIKHLINWSEEEEKPKEPEVPKEP